MGRAGRCGRNGTGNGGTGSPARAGRAAKHRGEKAYVGMGYVEVQGLLLGGGGVD